MFYYINLLKNKGGVYYVKNFSKISRKICKIYKHGMPYNGNVSSTKDACIINKKRLVKNKKTNRITTIFHIIKYKNRQTKNSLFIETIFSAKTYLNISNCCVKNSSFFVVNKFKLLLCINICLIFHNPSPLWFSLLLTPFW